MKLTCNRSELLSALQIVQMAVASRTTKPILSCVKAIAKDGELILMGSDLDVGIIYKLKPESIDRTGSAILPVARLVSILKESSDTSVTLVADGDTTKITIGRSKYELPGGDVDSFPDVEEPAKDSPVTIPAGVLRSMIKRTVFAAEKRENTRFAVTGVMWELAPNGLKLVATDTKRLAISEFAEDNGSEKPVSALIPVKAIQLLERNLDADGERIGVAIGHTQAFFTTDRATICTRLVEGKFPPYQQFLPKKLPIKIPLVRESFLGAIRAAAITSDQESKRVDFSFAPGKVLMESKGAESGHSEVELALPDYDGTEFTISFDPSFLTEMLRAVDDVNLVMEVTEAKDRAVIKAGDSFRYLVVPMIS